MAYYKTIVWFNLTLCAGLLCLIVLFKSFKWFVFYLNVLFLILCFLYWLEQITFISHYIIYYFRSDVLFYCNLYVNFSSPLCLFYYNGMLYIQLVLCCFLWYCTMDHIIVMSPAGSKWNKGVHILTKNHL